MIFEEYFNKYPERLTEYNELKKRYIDGESLTTLCKNSIYFKTRNMLSNLFKNDPNDNIKIRINGQKYNYNEKAFEFINDEASAYWLGFFYADGNINTLNCKCDICMSDKDYSHILKLCSYIFLDDNYNIVKRKSTLSNYDKTYYNYRLYIGNKKITNNLIKNNCNWNKTFNMKFPDNIEKKLMHHFIRGFFDGDGCVTHLKTNRLSVTFTSAERNFLIDLSDYLFENITISNTNVNHRKGLTYDYSIGAQFGVKNFYNYIYKDATIYLERKKEIFDSCFLPSIDKI